jgi:hypothetical protein
MTNERRMTEVRTTSGDTLADTHLPNNWDASFSRHSTVCIRDCNPPQLGWAGCAAALVCVAILMLNGCQSRRVSEDTSPETSAAARRTGVRTEKELGPVHVTVEVEPAPARLSDEPTLTITVVAEAGVDVQLPPFGDAVGDFVILDFREPLVQVRGDREVIRRIYSLEPPHTGTLEIDPITVTFTAPGGGAKSGSQSLETEALAIEVVSLVDAEAPSHDALQGLAPPVELPRKILWWPWLAAAVLLCLASAIGIFWLRRQRARLNLKPELSPRDIAANELHRIWQSQLHVQDIKRFYTELTGIVRRYIEGTVGVHAPEQTTEEFLREISGGQVFSADEGQRLRDFLESSDLVKFAAHQPGRDDIKAAFVRARAFVGIEGDHVSEQGGSEAPQVATHD